MFVGSYATAPKDASGESAFLAGLVSIPGIRGVETAIYCDGGLHKKDEAALLSQIDPTLEVVLTCIPGTMENLGKNPTFGLASDDDTSRLAAINFAKQALAKVEAMNSRAPDAKKVAAVEIHSGPTRKEGVASSQASFKASLVELMSWDWHGARLVVEHCDAPRPTHAASKGFLDLEDEILAIKQANQEGDKSKNGPVLMAVNWARSVLETRDTATPVQHIKTVKDAGLLGGLMFSGCSGETTPYGAWNDTHMPHCAAPGCDHFAEGSLMSQAEIQKCMDAVGDPQSLIFCGCKITAKHDASGSDVAMRIGLNADLVSLIKRASSADGKLTKKPRL